MITVRPERSEDIPWVRKINLTAFELPAEAEIVDRLRRNCPEALSLVAEEEGQIVGQILFSPVEVETGDKVIRGMGLAPLAVRPERQRQGIGSQLVRVGLDLLRDRSGPLVIVLGHPEYYPRFGFERASRYRLTSQWEGVPDEAWMIIVFDESVLQGVSGVARYRAEFDAVL
jgi:putative acetyltransferase